MNSVVYLDTFSFIEPKYLAAAPENGLILPLLDIPNGASLASTLAAPPSEPHAIILAPELLEDSMVFARLQGIGGAIFLPQSPSGKPRPSYFSPQEACPNRAWGYAPSTSSHPWNANGTGWSRKSLQATSHEQPKPQPKIIS